MAGRSQEDKSKRENLPFVRPKNFPFIAGIAAKRVLAFVSASCFRATALCIVIALAPLSAAQLGVRAGAMSSASRNSPHSAFSEKVGLYHWAGKMTDSVKGGVDRIAALGGRVARVTIAPTYYMDYNILPSCYTNFSLEALARIPDLEQALGNERIKVFILTTYDGSSLGDCAIHRYMNPDFYTADNTTKMVEEYAALTLQLHRAHQGSGKTFILANWEGDNALYCGSAYNYVTNADFRTQCDNEYPNIYGGNRSFLDSIAGMIRWIRARREGVALGSYRAATEGVTGVEVKLAVEFSMIRTLRDKGLPSVLYNVVPHVEFDYLSYSAYESINDSAPLPRLRADLDLVERLAHTRRIILGEIGYPRTASDPGTMPPIHQVIFAALAWGVDYVIYWNLFDESADNTYGLFDLNGMPTPVSRYFLDMYSMSKDAGGRRVRGYSGR